MRQFIFSWCSDGVESIIDISEYADMDKANTWNVLTDNAVERNPATSIIQNLLMRAIFNTQRHYEIYAIECDDSLDEECWDNYWSANPQECANLIRDRGIELHSDRATTAPAIT